MRPCGFTANRFYHGYLKADRKRGAPDRPVLARTRPQTPPLVVWLNALVRRLCGLYAIEWGEFVRILGGFGRDGQVTPPA